MSLEIEASLTKQTPCGHTWTGDDIDASRPPPVRDAALQPSAPAGYPTQERRSPTLAVG